MTKAGLSKNNTAKKEKTTSLAGHDIKGIILITISFSFRLVAVRVATIAGTLQPNASIMGITCLP